MTTKKEIRESCETEVKNFANDEFNFTTKEHLDIMHNLSANDGE